MPSLRKFSLLGALVAATALLALPVAAQATLVYVKNPFKPVVFAANDNGGADNGGPGLRPRYADHYYAAFVLDPDGHNIEAVCHTAEG